jgi:predicted cupin superfamily sugar epimerase
LGPAYSGSRAAASAVLFLLHPDEISDWHVVLSDELWIWQSGSPLLLILGGSGDSPQPREEIILGLDVAKGQRPQALVPANVWQKAQPLGSEPVLSTCIVAPAFHYDDFSLINKAK